MTNNTRLTVMFFCFLGLILITIFTSCSTRSLAHTPSKREIRKAMSYSTSEYATPDTYMGPGSVSPYKYAVTTRDDR